MSELRCTYHFVPNSNDGLPHRCIFPYRSYVWPQLKWAKDQFGEPAFYNKWTVKNRDGKPRGRWTTWNHDLYFSFRDEVDAFAFRVRWG
jgi:hypothetical protein